MNQLLRDVPSGQGAVGRRGRRRALWAAVAAVLIVTSYLAAAAALAFTAAGAVRDLRGILARTGGQGSITGADVDHARRTVLRAHEALDTLRSVSRPILWVLPGLEWLPRVGPTTAAVPALLDLAVTGTRAAARALIAATPAVTIMEQGGDRAALLGVLAAEAEDLRLAAAEVEEVERGISELASRPGVAGALAAALEDLRGPIARAGGALKLGAVLPHLLGSDGPVTYLILGQNRDELRATGGFISTAGLVTFNGGKVQELDYRDSYGFDPVQPRPFLQPPTAYQRYLLLQDWRLRDSNWWPDFPTSARQAEALLWMDQGRRVDGVIAFDQAVLLPLLEMLGPVHVAAYDEWIDAVNVIDVIEAYAHPTGYKEGHVSLVVRKVADGDRKAFMKALAGALQRRIETLDGHQLVQLARLLQTALDEKHLLVYLGDSELRRTIAQLGWDGGLGPDLNGDYLMLVETNVSYNKANRYVKRSLRYQVALGASGTAGTAQVALEFRNENLSPARHCSAIEVDFATADDSCYKSYLRLYTPAGTVPLSGSGLEDGLEWFAEGGKTVLAGLLVLPPGAAKTVLFTYKLPRAASGERQNEYRLYLQKQAGADPLPVSVTLCGGLVPSPPAATPACPQPLGATALTLKSGRLLRISLGSASPR